MVPISHLKFSLIESKPSLFSPFGAVCLCRWERSNQTHVQHQNYQEKVVSVRLHLNFPAVVLQCKQSRRWTKFTVWSSQVFLVLGAVRKTKVTPVLSAPILSSRILLRSQPLPWPNQSFVGFFFSDSCSCKILATFSTTNIHDSLKKWA